MIPIHRDNGAIVAFGGRAMDAGQQPKYLNSPETPIYVEGQDALRPASEQAGDRKARITRSWSKAISTGRRPTRRGSPNVVASSGTALTPAQARLLRRFASKVVLSFDPDAAGRARRRDRPNCSWPKASRSMSPCCRRAMIPITSFGGTAAPRTRKTAQFAAVPGISARSGGRGPDFSRMTAGGSFWGGC